MNKEQFTTEVLKAEKSLYHVAKSILGDEEDCADAIQEAILRAFSNRDSLKEKRYFKTWLTRILMNVCYSMKKKQKNQISYDEIPKPGREDFFEEKTTDVYQAVMDLEETLRLPFVLHYVEGFSVKEIARILDCSQGAVKTRLYRARKTLKESLKGEYGYE